MALLCRHGVRNYGDDPLACRGGLYVNGRYPITKTLDGGDNMVRWLKISAQAPQGDGAGGGVMGRIPDDWPVPIMVWPFREAPWELRHECDPNDADWLALIPNGMGSDVLMSRWLEVPAFGSCKVMDYDSPFGTVRVGYHA